jgi:serine/threonine protein kinase
MISNDNDNDNNNIEFPIVYIVDFGFSKKYLLPSGEHIEEKKNKSTIVGTLFFVSDYIINGMEASRRDDVISIIYILLYLYLDDETWKDIHKNINDDNYDKVFKIQILYEKLLLPKFFLDVLNYCYKISFYEEPKYDNIINILKK